MSEKTKYEVRKQRGTTWDTLRVFDKEDEARKFADLAFTDRTIAAINIVRDWTRADGMSIEKIIHTLSRTVEDKPVQIQTIEEAAPCATEEDFYGLNARLTISRLMKQYLDEQSITVTEVLHSFRDGKRLLDKDTLISAGVGMVSTLQAKAGTETAVERKKKLYDMMDRLMRRARDAENLPLPDLRKATLAEAFAKIDAEVQSPEERDFRARVMLTRAMANGRGYLGKLDILLAFMDQEPGEREKTFLDACLSDILQNTAVVQEVLGNQPNLATALASMINLSNGKLPDGTFQPDSIAGRLNKMFGGGAFPDSRYVMLDWVKRQLKGTGPLNRRDPTGENAAFMTLFKRFTEDEEWPGGPGMVEALTLRFGRRLPEGGATGRRKSIRGIVDLCDQPTLKISYLLALVGSETGTEQNAEIIGIIKELIGSKDSIQLFFGRNEGIVDKLRRVTRLYNRTGEVEFAEADRSEIRERLDDLLSRYVIESKIVESLDDPTKSLRIRATRLVQFCLSGALPPGRALKLAQQRAIEQLRQPNFEQAFVQDITDEKAKAVAIKDFFGLLKKAGLT